MLILNFRCRKSIAAVTLLLVGLLVPAKVVAQVDMGSIAGTIHDPSGAAIPNAKVVLTNDDTHITASTTSRAEGQYTFSPVKICRYSISRFGGRVQDSSTKERVPWTCSRRLR